MHYLYVLQLHDSSYYTGIAYDLKKRIKEHQTGKVLSTKGKLPVKINF